MDPEIHEDEHPETVGLDEFDGKIYQAIKPYSPKHDYELPLSTGELLTNIRHLPNNAHWAEGTSLGQQVTGLFPLSAVREYGHEAGSQKNVHSRAKSAESPVRQHRTAKSVKQEKKGKISTYKHLPNNAHWTDGTSLGQHKAVLHAFEGQEFEEERESNKNGHSRAKLSEGPKQRTIKPVKQEKKWHHRSTCQIREDHPVAHSRIPDNIKIKSLPISTDTALKHSAEMDTSTSNDKEKTDSSYLHFGKGTALHKNGQVNQVSYVNTLQADHMKDLYMNTGHCNPLEDLNTAEHSFSSANQIAGVHSERKNVQISASTRTTENDLAKILESIQPLCVPNQPVQCSYYPDPYVNVKQVDPAQVKLREQQKENCEEGIQPCTMQPADIKEEDAQPHSHLTSHVLQATKTSFQILNKKLIKSPRGKYRKFKLFTGALAGGLLGAILYLVCYYAIGYSLLASCIIAGLSTIIMSAGFAISVHCRCIALLMIPGLCTSRGRAATLSIIMTLLLNGPISNIFRNSEQASGMVTCTANIVRDQAELMQELVAKQIEAISRELKSTLKEAFDGIEKTLSELTDAFKKIKNTVSKVKNAFGIFSFLLPPLNVPDKIKKEFEFSAEFSSSIGLSTNSSKDPKEIEKDIKSELNKASRYAAQFTALFTKLMSFVVLLLFFQSYSYLKHYLQDDKFDNLYITQAFKNLDKKRMLKQCKETILPLRKKEDKYLTDTTSICLSPAERWKFAQGLVLMLIHCLLAGIICFFDFALFWLLSKIQEHGRIDFDIGSMHNITSNIYGEGAVARNLKEGLPEFNTTSKNPLSFNLSTAECLPTPFPPNYALICGISGVYIFTIFMTLLQAYGLRLRHKIVAFFYPERERARVVVLYNKLLRKRKSLLAIFRQKLKRENEPDLSKKNIRATQVMIEKIPCFGKVVHRFGMNKKQCVSCKCPCDSSSTVCDVPHCVGVFCEDCYSTLDYCCPICDDSLIQENQLSEDELNFDVREDHIV